MKKMWLTAVAVAVAILLCACGNGGENKDAESSSEADTSVIDTLAAEELDIDFATVRISGFAYGYIGGEETYVDTGAGTYKSSKPSIATVDENGKIIPKSEGVTLVGYEIEGEQYAIALCVFPEGQSADKASGGSPETVEVGKTYMHTAPVGGAQYSSSNEGVVSVAAAPQLSFVKSGYACITCNTVSRPFTYSFIVYDRVVE